MSATAAPPVRAQARVAGGFRRLLRWWPFILAVGALLWLILVPLVQLLLMSFQLGEPGLYEGWTPAHYAKALATPMTYVALRNTLVIAAAGTALSMLLAVFFAWLIERTDMPWRNLTWSLMILPMAMPGILSVLAWTLLLSPRTGYANVGLRSLLSLLGVSPEQGPFNIFSVEGLIFLDAMRGVTTIFIMIAGAFRLFDPSLEEAAGIEGAGTFVTLRRVTLPLLVPALLAAGMYSFIGSMDSFEAALAVGLPGGIFVFSTLIYFTVQLRSPIDYGLGAVYAVMFMLLMMVMVFFYRRIVARGEQFATVTGKAFRPRRIHLGKWRYPALGAVLLYALLTVWAPFLVMLWTSLLPTGTLTANALSDLDLSSYVRIATQDGLGGVVWNTAVMTVATATLTMMLAFVISWLIVRSNMRGRGLVDGLSFFPYALPGITIAIATIFVYLSPPFNSLPVYGTVWVLVIALATVYIAFGTRLMNGAVIQLHKDLEEAGQISGAKSAGVLAKITLPLLAPAFLAGWVWVAAHSVRAFSIPLILRSRGNEVVGVRLWEYWSDGHFSESAALGVLLMLVLLPSTVLLRRLMVRASGGA